MENKVKYRKVRKAEKEGLANRAAWRLHTFSFTSLSSLFLFLLHLFHHFPFLLFLLLIFFHIVPFLSPSSLSPFASFLFSFAFSILLLFSHHFIFLSPPLLPPSSFPLLTPSSLSLLALNIVPFHPWILTSSSSLASSSSYISSSFTFIFLPFVPSPLWTASSFTLVFLLLPLLLSLPLHHTFPLDPHLSPASFHLLILIHFSLFRKHLSTCSPLPPKFYHSSPTLCITSSSSTLTFPSTTLSSTSSSTHFHFDGASVICCQSKRAKFDPLFKGSRPTLPVSPKLAPSPGGWLIKEEIAKFISA